MAKSLLLIAAISGLIVVMFGAFGAHGLKGKLSTDLLAIYSTAVEYQFYHTLGLLAVGLLALQFPQAKLFFVSGLLFIAGIIIFSGSLYILALSGVRWLGAITPIGGVAFIAGWLLLAIGIYRHIPGGSE